MLPSSAVEDGRRLEVCVSTYCGLLEDSETLQTRLTSVNDGRRITNGNQIYRLLSDSELVSRVVAGVEGAIVEAVERGVCVEELRPVISAGA